MNWYNSISRGYDELYKDEQLKKLAIIKENLDITKDKKLLDVGSGTGFSIDYFDCQVTGLEPSYGMAYISRNTILGRAESIPFDDESFDIVISVTAIHNFNDIPQGLDEMKRVGKDQFAFSILKKSKKLDNIKKEIEERFSIEKEIEEDKDMVLICKKL